MLNFEYNGKFHTGWSDADARAAGIPAAIIGAALKDQAHADIAHFANTYRARLASTSAGKVDEYRVKAEIARDPASATLDELSMIDREATARGIDRDALINLIDNRASAWRQIALLIGAIEAETKAAITAIPDAAAGIETQIHTVLGAAKAQAEAAFVEATALINGGS